jgi:hypothetical protein
MTAPAKAQWNDGGPAIQAGDRNMQMKRDHLAFDEALELLCMLSEWPFISFLADLRLDLGYDTQGQVEDKLRTLKGRGFKVESSLCQIVEPAGRSGRAAWIEPAGNTQAAAAAQDYFEKVYAASPEAATPVVAVVPA